MAPTLFVRIGAQAGDFNRTLAGVVRGTSGAAQNFKKMGAGLSGPQGPGGALRAFGQEASRASRLALSFATSFKGVLTGFIGAQAIIGAARSAFRFASDAAIGMNASLETSTLQFKTLMGSATLAEKHVRSLFEFAKKTPFSTEPILQASKFLQQFGGEALNNERILTLIGDAAAATGADFAALAMWTGRMFASLQAGKPFGEASQRLTEMAVLTPQARLEMEAMAAAGFSAQEIFARFEGVLGSFSGAMQEQSQTWRGAVSTFWDQVKLRIADQSKGAFDLLRLAVIGANEALEASNAANAGAATGGEQLAAVLNSAGHSYRVTGDQALRYFDRLDGGTQSSLLISQRQKDLAASMGTTAFQALSAEEAQRKFNAAMDDAAGDALKAKAAAAEHAQEIGKLVAKLGGGEAISAARTWMEAVDQIGGVTKLSEKDQQTLNDTLGEALAAYARLGQVAPAAMERIFNATKQALEVTERFSARNVQIAGLPTVKPKIQPTQTFSPATLGLFGAPTATGLPPAGPGAFSGFADLLEGGRVSDVILSAITGGGSITKGIGALFGGQIGKNLAGGAVGKALTGALGGKIGGLLGSALPGIGNILGAVGGDLIGKLFGGLFGPSKAEKETKQATGELKELEAALISANGGQENFARLQQALGIAVTDFNASVKVGQEGLAAWKDRAEEFTTQLGAMREEMQQLAQSGGLASQELMRFVEVMGDSAEVSGFLKSQASQGMEALAAFVGSAASQTRAGIQAAMTAAVAFFETAVAHGASFSDTLRQMAPTFGDLSARLKQMGVESVPAFDRIAAAAKLVTNEVSGPLIRGAEDAGRVLISLANIGQLDAQTFSQLGATIKHSFDRLLKGGASSTVALTAMQQPISALIQLQDRFGFTVDKGTQAILDQARKQGIAGAQMRSTEEKTLDVLLAIGETLGAKLPAWAEQGRQGVGRAFQGMTTDAGTTASGIQRQFDRIRINVPVGFTTTDKGFAVGDATVKIRGLAEGGIVRRPGVFALAEGGRPEAVIPLDRGLSGMQARDLTVTLVLEDGRVLAQQVVPFIPEVLGSVGARR